MNNEIYTKLNDILVWSNYYKALCDKTDIYSGRSRIISVKDLVVLATEYAKKHGLNDKLAELIVNSRELGFFPYGETGYNFIREKYEGFSQADCSIAILKNIIEEYNSMYNTELVIPEELILGIECSFNKEYTPANSEGVMVCMVNDSYGLSRNISEKTLTAKEKGKRIEDLDYAWNMNMSSCETTNENIAKNILKYTEAELRGMGNFCEE